MSGKCRLDVLLVKKGIASSRERARTMIMEGSVYVDGVREDKAGSSFSDDADIEYRGERLRYVSRGGLKLEKAVECFSLDLTGLICMDIGASTGGFTDCMLQNGAARVYAIDVGYGQLDWSLRNDERVRCMERTNFRYLTKGDIPDTPEFATVDVSFISLSRILPAASGILSDTGRMVCLIKPQFEAGRGLVGKKGVVRDPSVHEDVILSCMGYAEHNGFFVSGLDHSPIKGPEGNIEYLMYITKEKEAAAEDARSAVSGVVGRAHEGLR
ncbi:MAG: TlyA family RNA methyltransferase [Lachnospiraceae bacterium]|nr:TlyA family RNA methyltransferase [Lachnospiraceae bacterium]